MNLDVAEKLQPIVSVTTTREKSGSLPLWIIKQVTDLPDENFQRFVLLNTNIWKKIYQKGF